MRRILCYGDSNTWGYIPGGTRLKWQERWTGVLQNALGDHFQVIENGLNSRTSAFDEPEKPYLNGLTGFASLLVSQKPLDALVIMLGTNDLKHHTPQEIKEGLRALIREATLPDRCYPSTTPVFPHGFKCLILAPIRISEACSEGALQGKAGDSQVLETVIEALCHEEQVDYLAASRYAAPSSEDGVHMTQEGHASLGKAVAQRLISMFFGAVPMPVPGNTKERVIRAMLAMQRHPWEQGVCAQALYEAGLPEYWVPMAREAVNRQAADGRLSMPFDSAAVSDPAAAGEVCLRAYEQTGETLYHDGAEKMLHYLLKIAPRTKDGIICHNEISFHEGYSALQLWIDGAYMVPPFLAAMGETEEALHQLRGYIKHLFDEEAGLFYHIVDTANERFVRKKHWATGNGWALLGLARTAAIARQQGKETIADELDSFKKRLLDAMLRYQLPDGRFRDILDEKDSFADGTSAMMVSAVIYRGVLQGTLESSYLPSAEKAFQTVLSHIGPDGLLHEVCGCPHFLAPGISAEAQAAFLMANAYREKLYYWNNNNIC